MQILLGSQSPRRKELLANLGIHFNVQNIHCEEIYPNDLDINSIAAFLAEKKNKAYTQLLDHQLLITSDTIVICENNVLGKPKNTPEAMAMLQMLSGKTHRVDTAVCMRYNNTVKCQISSSYIDMHPISEEEAAYYVQHFEVLDKAGAYGIQDWLGRAKIKEIRGSYYGIMGFPTDIVYQMLLDFGVKFSH